MVSSLPITGQNTEGSQKFERLRNILESWGISWRVGEGFRGFEECFGGFYKAERELKNFGGAREGAKEAKRGVGGDRECLEGHGRGQRKLGWAGRGQRKLRGAVREDSLGLCSMCFEVKNDYQKLSLLKDYFNPISTGLFCLVVALGHVLWGGSTPFHKI